MSSPPPDSPCHGFPSGDNPSPLVIEEIEIGIKISRGTLEQDTIFHSTSECNMEEDDSGNEVTGEVKKQKRGKRGKGKVVDLTNLIVEGKRRDQGKIQTVSHDK